MNYKTCHDFLKETIQNWLDDDAPRMGAALAFYSIISIGPLLVVVIALAGLVFGQAEATERILGSIGGLVGSEGANAVKIIIDNSHKETTGLIATIVGIATLIFGASGVFSELQSALNSIWNVRPKPNQGIWRIIQNRFLSVGMVLGTAFLLLISLVISTALSAFSEYIIASMPNFKMILAIIAGLFNFAVIPVLFAMIFKYLPDAKIRWKDVWVGGFLTALLFIIGKFLIGYYLGHSDISSSYGAAGSLIILLLWIYYSAQIIFLGAEMTKTYADHYGSGVIPNKNAIKVIQKEIIARSGRKKKRK